MINKIENAIKYVITIKDMKAMHWVLHLKFTMTLVTFSVVNLVQNVAISHFLM